MHMTAIQAFKMPEWIPCKRLTVLELFKYIYSLFCKYYIPVQLEDAGFSN